MIKNLLFFIALALVACNSSKNSGLAVVSYESSFDTIEPSRDFIDIKHYIVNNTGASWSPDTIYTNCPCLIAFYKREPIAPGDTLIITTQLYSIYEEGQFDKTVTVMTGLQGEKAMISLKVKGFVDVSNVSPKDKYLSKHDELWFKSTSFDFGTVLQGSIAEAKGEVYNASNRDITFTGMAYMPEYIQFDFFPRTIKPGETAQIKALFSTQIYKDVGKQKLDMEIRADSGIEVLITTFIDVLEDFSGLTDDELANAPKFYAADTFYSYGEIIEGEVINKSFTIENKGKSNMIIRKVESGCGCTAVTPNKRVLSPGESTEIKATFNSNKKVGNTRVYIRVITNDPKKPVTHLVLDGVVVEKD